MLRVSKDSVYFISEIGLNHNGDFFLAKNLIDISITAKASAVKFQKRDVNRMFINSILNQPFDRFPALGTTVREVRQSLELSKEVYTELRNYCRDKIDFIVTPFDIPSLEFLDDLDLDAFKIASHNNTDIPLLKELNLRGKPVIVSVGMCSRNEVERLINTLKDVELTLLYCVSSYPVNSDDVNLNMIQWLKHYGCRVGYSDHEDGFMFAPVAVALGAEVIEKHITLDKNMKGFDHHMSLDPTQLIQCVRSVNLVKSSLLKPADKQLQPCEIHMFDNRRYSIYAACDIKCGTKLQKEMLAVKAPLKGLTPRFFEKLIGVETLYDLKEDDPITFGVVNL